MSKKTMNDFYEKYAEVIIAMYKKTGDDTSVCIDKLVYMTEHRNDKNADLYEGIPEGFDFAQCQIDINEILRADK